MTDRAINGALNWFSLYVNKRRRDCFTNKLKRYSATRFYLLHFIFLVLPDPQNFNALCLTVTGTVGVDKWGGTGGATVSRPPVLTLGDSCVPASVNSLQYHVTGSILMVAGPFQLPAPRSGTLSRILSGTRPSVQTVSDACLRRICLPVTSAFSALEVL